MWVTSRLTCGWEHLGLRLGAWHVGLLALGLALDVDPDPVLDPVGRTLAEQQAEEDEQRQCAKEDRQRQRVPLRVSQSDGHPGPHTSSSASSGASSPSAAASGGRAAAAAA